MLYEVKPDDRIFTVTKSYLDHEMRRGVKEAGLKKIKVHALRHSHVSLLIHMGFTVLAIAERMGHEAEKITLKYAHLFPTVQTEMAEKLDMERMKTVAFRVSEEEAKQIDVCVRLSGLTKQDYIVRRLMCRDIVVQGNPRVYKALKNQMAELYEELKRIEQFSEENEELLYTLQLVAETLNGMKEDED